MGFQVEFERENAVWLSVFRILTSGMGQTDGQAGRTYWHAISKTVQLKHTKHSSK